MSEILDTARDNIEKNGCHIVYVERTEDHPAFGYSIGFEQSLSKPEILVTGMDKDNTHFLINEYYYRLKDGEAFEPDGQYADFIEDFNVCFKAIDPKHHATYFDLTCQYYDRDDFRALHLIWPDMDGLWPWDKKASKEYRAVMPRLYVG